jgi:L-amino acid N-acyltransferase YncA
VRSGNATADTVELANDYGERWFENHSNNKHPIYVIENSTEILGWGSLSPYRKGRGSLVSTAEISYYIDYSHHGHGYAKQLVTWMIRDCEKLKIENLVAILLSVNTKSIELLKYFEFSEWGRLPKIANLNNGKCDHLIYGRHLK